MICSRPESGSRSAGGKFAGAEEALQMQEHHHAHQNAAGCRFRDAFERVLFLSLSRSVCWLLVILWYFGRRLAWSWFFFGVD